MGSREPEGNGGRVRASDALAFALEVALLGASGLWAIEVLPLFPLFAILVVVVPLIAFWGLFMAPTAPYRIAWPAHPVVAHGLFLLGSGLLFGIERTGLGLVMLVLTGMSAFLAWRHRSHGAAEARPASERRRGQPARRSAGRRTAR
ncbi:YrdB family protein [Arthrobacter sp. KK5.5]|uniref:YrdB family protein n=1 Tax=Arthrobacter sp. KK5.5 TaxID=3373084 RepID=UPI003EE64FC5